MVHACCIIRNACLPGAVVPMGIKGAKVNTTEEVSPSCFASIVAMETAFLNRSADQAARIYKL